jgi:hypothetical protein
MVPGPTDQAGQIIAPLAADGIQVVAVPGSVFSATCHKNVSPVVLVAGRRGRPLFDAEGKPCDESCW